VSGSRLSCKRSSDSSLEDEEIGSGVLKKKIRFSSDSSEVSDINPGNENIESFHEHGGYSKHSTSTESESNICEKGQTSVEKSPYKPVATVASSKSSMQALSSLLADDGGSKINIPVGKTQHLNQRISDTPVEGNDIISPDEIDAPHVVWVDEENDIGGLNVEKSSKNQRSTRSGSSRAHKDVPVSNPSNANKRETRTSKSKSNSNAAGTSVSIQPAAAKKQRKSLLSEVPRNAIFMLSGLNENVRRKKKILVIIS